MPEPRKRGARGPAPASEANLRDVAARAGVSPATVSRVFSGGAIVREETRVKVLQAAEELGYVVNRLAQAMLGVGQRSLAIVTASMDGPAFADVASAAEKVATENGHLFLLALTHGDVERETAIIETLREQRSAGVLLLGTTAPGPESETRIAGYASALASVNARLVLCGHPYLAAAPKILTVNYDQVGGVRRAVRHLTAQGHKRIAFLGMADSTTASQRQLGYSLGLSDAWLDIDPELTVPCTNDVVGAHLAALLLLKTPNPPTAIVCLTDVIATGVYRAARDFSISIPTQLAVVGFDDSPYTAALMPSLTSIHAPFADIGRLGAQLALHLVDHTSPIDLPTELVVRESTR